MDNELVVPMAFQRKALRGIDGHRGRCLVAFDPGLGKTLISLWWVERDEEDRLPALVVCPASVKWQWEREVLRLFGIRPTVSEGRKPPKTNPKVPWIRIINFDILHNWLPWLMKTNWQTVIIDECQYLANPGTKRTRAVRKLSKRVPYLLGLSGTPLVNRPIELFPTINLLDSESFASRMQFGMDYCAGRRGLHGWDFRGSSKPKELHRKLLDSCMIRQRKSSVLKQLPKKVRTTVPIELKNRAEYDRADTDFLVWLRSTNPSAAVRAQRAMSITKTGYLLRLAAEEKVDGVASWINDMLDESGEKMLVFAVHKSVIRSLSEQIESKSVIVDGSVTGKKRREAVDSFQKNESVRVLIGNIRAAGVGLNLTKASIVAFAEFGWRPGDLTQCEDRAHRIGQLGTVWAYYLVARNTIEERLISILSRKQSVLSAVLDGGRQEEDLDVLEELIKGMADENTIHEIEPSRKAKGQKSRPSQKSRP